MHGVRRRQKSLRGIRMPLMRLEDLPEDLFDRTFALPVNRGSLAEVEPFNRREL